MLVTFVFAVLFLVVLDQFTKYKALIHLKDINTFPIIQNVFHFTFVENRGLLNTTKSKNLLIIITTIVLIGIYTII